MTDRLKSNHLIRTLAASMLLTISACANQEAPGLRSANTAEKVTDRAHTAATAAESTASTATARPAAADQQQRPSPGISKLEGDLPQRVLFVGNSYFYYNNSLHNHVRRLVDAADPAFGKSLRYKSATIGGSPLEHHAIDHYLTPNALGVKEPFDLVILQTESDAAMSDRASASYDRTVDSFAAKIRAAGGRVALYITPSYVPPHRAVDPQMSRRTTTMIIKAANRVGALAIPVGPAFDEAYRRRPDLSLHQSYDGSHPNLAGSYLAACVVYASIYGRTPVGNGYDYYGRLDRATAAWLQQVAADVVAQFSQL